MNEEYTNLLQELRQEDGLGPLIDIVEAIMNIPDASLTDDNIDVIKGMVLGGFTPDIKENSITEIVTNFKREGLSKTEAMKVTSTAAEALATIIETIEPSQHKLVLLNAIAANFDEIFKEALDRYLVFDVKVQVKLAEGAKMPTYANEHAACADVYALEDTTVKAHTLGNKIHTGVYFGLPENWEIGILPRSSIGSKTPLRLSNSRGVLDEDYRGELIVLYDNISDSDYEIKAGDRIAQIWVQPVYRFSPILVNELDETERGEGGFGSTGK